jgi:hypothetical protein
MTSSGRLDIIVGLLAGGIAVLGIGVSLLSRNEDAGLFGWITMSDQGGLLAMALAILGATIAKAIGARRS